jgi:CTP synthase (UTP-ammonia lyase)
MNGSVPPKRIALVGDYSPDVLAHQAIERCFELIRQTDPPIERQWLATEDIVPGEARRLESFDGVWCVPASPYRNTAGALWAIEFARTYLVPFLGTCGGYQHALLEFARNALAFKEAGHAELDPTTTAPLLHRMPAALLEQSQNVFVTAESFRVQYGALSGVESFHCSYGLNPSYEHLFANSALEVVARSADGQARAFRLKNHPFFVGTAFQPERQALAGSLHHLVQCFSSAVASRQKTEQLH